MKKLIVIAVMLTFAFVTDGSAQNSGGGSASTGSSASANTRKTDFSIVLNKITSVEIVTHRIDGTKLPRPRHLIVGSYTPKSPPCPTGKVCTQVLPAPVQASVFLRSWEYRNDSKKAHMLNVCLRTIESAGSDSSVILRGDFTYNAQSTVFLMHSISSCFVGTGAQIN